MKIGIITFSASSNCGSMLQAYALQEILKRKYNADVNLINFANRGSRNIYGLIDWELNRLAIRRNLNTLRHLPTFFQSKRDYTAFANVYLNNTQKKYRSEAMLRGIERNYDILIAGGDQVWNVRCSDADDAFFLSFAKDVRKVAYAPSLGGSNIFKYANDVERYKKYLLDFEKLSVREPNGKKWLEQLTSREVPIIADPTLLLTQQEWTGWLPVPEVQGKYIFNYAFYHNHKETNQALQKISNKTGMPIFVMDIKSWAFYHLDRYGIRKYGRTGPLAFLGLMKNASLIMTQSFHGTLFSALFNKPFWSYNWLEFAHSEDDRATAILNQFGMPERYQLVNNLIDMNVMEPIDYADCNQRIERLRATAFDFIDSFINK